MVFCDCYLVNERTLKRGKNGIPRFKYDIINNKGEIEFLGACLSGVMRESFYAGSRIIEAGNLDGEQVYKLKYELPNNSANIIIQKQGGGYRIAQMTKGQKSEKRYITPQKFSKVFKSYYWQLKNSVVICKMQGGDDYKT